jgi:hypothetical protein
VDARLVLGKAAGVSVTGAFAANATKGIPDFKVRISSGGLDAGFVSLGDKAYFVRGDTGWRVPAALWTPLVQTAARGTFAVHPATWARDVKSEGTATVNGVETDHVSATIDPKVVVNDLAQGVRQGGGKLPQRATLTRGVKRGELDAWVGKDDHILRRLSAKLVFAGRAPVQLDLRLSQVNEPQQIQAPLHVRAGAPAGTLGTLAQGIAGRIGGVTGDKNVSLSVLTSPNPGRAARAVRDHKQVVILFRNSRGLDDRAMTSVMRDVDRRTKALVLTDEVDAVDRYGKLVEDLGVSQTPSVVIIDRSGKAQLIEGYVDSDTLTQAVADAR